MSIYNVVIDNKKEVDILTKAQEKLKEDIKKITDESILEKVQIFVMGILTQKDIEETQKANSRTA